MSNLFFAIWHLFFTVSSIELTLVSLLTPSLDAAGRLMPVAVTSGSVQSAEPSQAVISA